MTKPKGEVVGSIKLCINSKFRISHVEIEGSGDLISKRMILDSSALIFRAITQARSTRKRGSRAGAEAADKADARDTEKLTLFKKKKAAEKQKDEDFLLAKIEERKTEVEGAAEKAQTRITSKPAPAAVDPAEARKKAQDAANKTAEQIAANHAGKGSVLGKLTSKLKTEVKTDSKVSSETIEPVTAATPKEK